MSFEIPRYFEPDFEALGLTDAPDARLAVAECDGVAPAYYHSTSMYPEYFKICGTWMLAEESRMDSSVVYGTDGVLHVVENRNLKKGDSLMDLLRYERDHGKVVWVMGPAFAFDHDARHAMQRMVEEGYVDAVMAGNALATHDLEGGMLHTALGQDIYTQESVRNGHYNHLDVLNEVRRSGSIPQFVEDHDISDGIMYALVKKNVPFVLTSSIRDDGPLPEVIADAYEGQSAMRNVVKDATTVICLATMLHTIATGNMVPSFRVLSDGTVRPVFFYAVDADEFVVNKLHDRGSLSATTIVTNVQDFIVIIAKGLGVY